MKEIPPKSRGWGLFRDEYDNLFEGYLRPMQEQELDDDGESVPRIDAMEQDRRFIVEVELPGVKKDDIDISMRDGVLTINAEIKDESGQIEQGRVIRRERRYGRFVRSMSFGGTVDEGNISARYSDGILTVTVPKLTPRKPEKIDIAVK